MKNIFSFLFTILLFNTVYSQDSTVLLNKDFSCNTPPPTIINSIQEFCVSKWKVIEDIEVVGQNVLWYDSLTSTTPLDKRFLFQKDEVLYATQTIDGCESTERLKVQIYVFGYYYPKLNILCNGLLSDVEVNFNNSKGSYQYSIDNKDYQSDNTFLNISDGYHTLKIKDNNGCLLSFSFSTACNLSEYVEDFGQGMDTHMMPYGTTTTYKKSNLYNCPPEKIYDGNYIITSNTGQSAECINCYANCNRIVGDLLFSGWYQNITDHTGNKNGRFMLVNADRASGEFLRKTYKNLLVGEEYDFSLWIANILNPVTGCTPAKPVNITCEFYDGAELVAKVESGNIMPQNNVEDIWQRVDSKILAPNKELTMVLRNNSEGGCGNDLAIDDIEFKTEASLSVSQHEKQFDSEIYPNPVQDVLTISQSGDISTVKLYDIFGQLLLKINNNQNSEIKLDLANYPKGIYILKADSNMKQLKTIKLFKK